MLGKLGIYIKKNVKGSSLVRKTYKTYKNQFQVDLKCNVNVKGKPKDLIKARRISPEFGEGKIFFK